VKIPGKILVTGARGGIGRALVELLLDAGYEVWGTARNSQSLDGTGVHAVALDLENPASIEAAAQQILAEAGTLHAVVHNAGDGVFGPADQFPEGEMQRQFAVLCHGPWHLARLLLPAIEQNGRNIFVSSLAARMPIPGMAAYNAAKAALGVLAATARLEPQIVQRHWIEVQAGDTRTAFNDAARRFPVGVRQAAFDRLWKHVDAHLKHGVAPEQIARTIFHAITTPRPPVRLTAGDFFQTKLAILAWRLLPARVMEALIRKFYGL